MISLAQRLKANSEQLKVLVEQFGCDLRVACPGIIKAWNNDEQTVTVQLTLTENIRKANKVSAEVIPPLVHVPILIPRAGGFSLTIPPKSGDECLVVFADMCIDAWWQSGGVQNQLDKRRHDLSDGFAILGCWSQPKKLSNYSTNSAQLRTDDGATVIDVAESGVTVTGTAVNVHATNATVQATAEVDVVAPAVVVNAANHVAINGNGNTTIEGRNFLTHTHTGVRSGTEVSGGVL